MPAKRNTKNNNNKNNKKKEEPEEDEKSISEDMSKSSNAESDVSSRLPSTSKYIVYSVISNHFCR